MNTFILKWNPAISSYGMDQFNYDFEFYNTKILEEETPWDFNWSVWEYEKAHKGDRFFVVKVGDGENNGIVMSGVFNSEPYEGEDWSGKDRNTHYMYIRFDIVVDLNSDKVLPTSLLTEQLLIIEWTKGHSGVLIEPDAALTIEKLWYAHIKADLSKEAKATQLARIAHFGQKDKGGEDYINHPLRVSRDFSGTKCAVALLHDVVEDSAFTLEDLAKEGFSKAVVSGVNAMTRKDGETYDTFIRRAGRNKIAREVKMADLRDNLDLLRLPELTEEDLQRVVKYHKAYKYLSNL